MLRGAPRRLTRTVLFTDIVGSTETAAQLGDQRWRGTVAQHHAVVRRELRRFHGHEVDTAGDGFFAIFEAPTEAVRCAAAIVPAVRGIGLGLRVGIHTGDVETSGEKVSGIAVHIGARLMAMAGPGEVLVSGTVRDLVAGSGDEFVDRGRQELKGVPGTWHVYALVLAEAEGAAGVGVSDEAEERRAVEARRRRLLGAGVAGLVVLAAAIAAMVVVLSRSGPPVTAVATPPPSAEVSPSPSATASPTELPRPLPGTRALPVPATGELNAGVTYSPLRFVPAFTLVGVSAWWAVVDIREAAVIVQAPQQPQDVVGRAMRGQALPDELVLVLMQPNRVIPMGGGAPIPVPSDLLTWLESRSDLDLSPTSPVTIGGFSGARLEGTIRAGSQVNERGGINLICMLSSECTWISGTGLISLGADRTIEIVVLNVRGDQVVMAAEATSAVWPGARAKVDELLAGLTFVPGG